MPPRGWATTRSPRDWTRPRQVVSKWRKRFVEQRLPGLADLPRAGRPPSFPPDVVVAVKALACELPATAGQAAGPLAVPGPGPRRRRARHRRLDLGHHHLALAQSRMRSSPGSTAPGSSPATPTSPPRPDGCSTCTPAASTTSRCGADEFVISADEKTSIQARIRNHPTTPPGAGPADARRTRIRPRRRAGLPGRLGRAPRPGVRPLRADHRHRTRSTGWSTRS